MNAQSIPPTSDSAEVDQLVRRHVLALEAIIDLMLTHLDADQVADLLAAQIELLEEHG